MATRENQSQLLICTSCGKPAEPRQYICEHCSAPLTPYAHSDPVMGIMARGFAAHKATTAAHKPIIVVGMWLWMVPMFFIGIGLTVLGIGTLAEEFRRGNLRGLFGLPVAALGVAFVWIASTILIRTTRSFFDRCGTRAKFEENSGAPDDDSEPIECLECGQPFSSDEECCPKCGWTYQ